MCRKPTFFSFLLFILASTHVEAQDGRITFNGVIRPTSCVIDIGGTGANGTVTMDTVSAAALKAAGDRIGVKPFTIQIGSPSDACSSSRVQAFFYNRGNVNAAGRLNNSSGTNFADNVEVVLLNGGGQDIDLSNNTGSPIVDIDQGMATLDFAAQYYATGVVGGGDVMTDVEYTVIYP